MPAADRLAWTPAGWTGELTLRKELLLGGRLELHAERATAEISGCIGLLAGRTSKTASLEALTEAAATGWAAQ
jgi:hypothetical protein